MKKLFTILLFCLSIQAFSQVGINTNNPTATIDINGDMRIRYIPIGSNTDSLLSTDINGFIHKVPNSSYVVVGIYRLYQESYDSATFMPNVTTGINSYSIGIGNTTTGVGNYNLGIFNSTNGMMNSSFGNNNYITGTIANSYGNNNIIKGDQSYVYGSFNFIDTLVSNGFIFGKEDTLKHESSYLYGLGLTSHTNEEYVFGRYNTKYTPTLTTKDRAYTFAYGSNIQPKNYMTILKNGIVGIGQDSLENTTSTAKLQVAGEIYSEPRIYASHAAATADPTLKKGTMYVIGTTGQGLFIKR